jgi:ATP-dependent DNA helicase RecG
MELYALIAECTAYDFKVMLEEKKSKSWLKSVSAFANGLGGSLFFGIDNEGTIFASNDTPNVGDHDGDVSETKLSERQQKILNLIKESPTITGKQMSETLSVSQRTIERDLSALQKVGILNCEGKDNDGKWVIVNWG